MTDAKKIFLFMGNMSNSVDAIGIYTISVGEKSTISSPANRERKWWNKG
jgi:hypothetical protein